MIINIGVIGIIFYGLVETLKRLSGITLLHPNTRKFDPALGERGNKFYRLVEIVFGTFYVSGKEPDRKNLLVSFSILTPS